MNKPQSPPIYKVTHRSGQVSWQVDLGMVDGKRKRVNFATKARPRTNRIRSRDLSRADRLQRFASCFLSAAVPGGASIVKVEAAGGGGTTLTSAAEPYNASGKHEAHMAGSNCCPDFAATAGHSAYASRMGNRMETSFRTFFGTRFPSRRLPQQGDRRPLLFQCPSRVQSATGYCPSPVRSASSETHKLA